MDFRSSISDFRSLPRRRGFTLIELLVVVGIIMIVASLLLVGTSMARRAARKARTSADMQTIATALEAYKQDFGDYPRLNYQAAGTFADPRGSANVMDFLPLAWGGNGQGGKVIAGSELLAWALVGPYDAAPNPYVLPSEWHPYDGKTGFGMRVGVNPRGTVYGPYVDPDRFLRNPANDAPDVNPTGRMYFYLQDNFRQPILYFVKDIKPARDPSTLGPNQSLLPTDWYNINDNAVAFFRGDAVAPADRFNAVALYRMAGSQIGGKTTLNAGPYLLWSAGEDEQFSVADPTDGNAVEKCDDVLFWAGQ